MRRPMNSTAGLGPMTAVLLASLWMLLGCSTTRPPTKTTRATCSLQLQDGFSHQRITVFADGARVFSGSVTSDPVLGFAKAIAIPIQDSRLQLRIEMPASGAVYAWSLDLRRGHTLGIMREVDGRLTLRQRAGPFFYE